MTCVGPNHAYAFGPFGDTGPVTGYASDGVHSQTDTKGPIHVNVGNTLAGDGKEPGDGSMAAGHGDVFIQTATIAYLTARACTDGVAGHTATGYAQQGAVKVTASPYPVEYRYRSIRLNADGPEA